MKFYSIIAVEATIKYSGEIMKIKFGSFEFEVDEPSDLLPVILPIVGTLGLVVIAIIEVFGGK